MKPAGGVWATPVEIPAIAGTLAMRTVPVTPSALTMTVSSTGQLLPHSAVAVSIGRPMAIVGLIPRMNRALPGRMLWNAGIVNVTMPPVTQFHDDTFHSVWYWWSMIAWVISAAWLCTIGE